MRSPRNPRFWLLIVLVGAIFLSFIPVLNNALLSWDDKQMILDNPHLRGWSLENLRWYWTTFHLGPYQPLSWITLAMDHVVWGLNPKGYHATNLLLHAANGSLLCIILYTLTRSSLSAFLGAMLFAVHPLRVESVAWATERRDVLSGLFFLAGWLAYLRFHESKTRGSTMSSWPAVAFIFFVLAMLSKVTAIGLIWILCLTDLCEHRRFRNIWPEKLPFILAGAVLAAVGWAGARREGLFFHPYSFLERVAFYVYGATFYVQKTLLPWHLSPLYCLPSDPNILRGEILVRSLLFGAFTVWIFSRHRRDRRPAFFWLAYLLILVPVSGIAQNGRQIAADRYTYLSCLPWSWGVALLLSKRRSLPLEASVGFVVVILMGLTWRQTGFWKNDRTLWERAIATDPANRIAHYNLGTLQMETDPEAARQEFLAALRSDPNDPEAHYNLALLCSQSGRTSQALFHYQETLRLRPKSLQAMNNMAVVYMSQRKLPEAMSLLDRALAIDDRFAEARFNRGVLLMMQGKRRSGETDLHQAVHEQPALGLRLRLIPGLGFPAN